MADISLLWVAGISRGGGHKGKLGDKGCGKSWDFLLSFPFQFVFYFAFYSISKIGI